MSPSGARGSIHRHDGHGFDLMAGVFQNEKIDLVRLHLRLANFAVVGLPLQKPASAYGDRLRRAYLIVRVDSSATMTA